MQESIDYEQAVVSILRELPPERKAQVLDFAVFMRLQSRGLLHPGEPFTEEHALMLASIQSLAKFWNTPEEDEAWANCPALGSHAENQKAGAGPWHSRPRK